MASRTTLKLSKPIDPDAPPRPKTTRARDALRKRHQGLVVQAAPAQAAAQPRDPKGAGSRPPRDAKAQGSRPPRDAQAKGSRPPRDAKAQGSRPPRDAKAQGSRPPRDAGRAVAKPQRDANEARPRPPREVAAGEPPRARPLPGDPDHPRLSKVMSERGVCSRREADEWIENGWVRVDGQVVTALGTRIRPDAAIEIDPAARRHQGEQVTILLHKPMGYVSGQPEDDHPPAMALITPDNRWPEDPSPLRFQRSHLRGLAPAGRLDIDSTGLLVFTQDGRVARRLIGADSEVEKEYLVRVEGTLADADLERLRHGLELDGVKLKPARVSWQNEEQLRFVLREGRKRQIRRMCEMVGLRVTGLKRVRTGGVPLGKLPPGQWRYLRRDEKF